MKLAIEKLIDESGKNTSVQFDGKTRRVSFDENFGKDKLDIIEKALGDNANKKSVFQKMSK